MIEPIKRYIETGRRFRELSRRDRHLILRASWTLPVVVIALRCAGLRRTLRWFEPAYTTFLNESVATRELSTVRRGLGKLSRITGVGTCLSRAIAARYMLGRCGVQVVLRIGVRKNCRGLDAHAWVEPVGESTRSGLQPRAKDGTGFAPFPVIGARQAPALAPQEGPKYRKTD